jgi:hypothetical protein
MLSSLFARRQPRRAAGFRPRLEVLEDRDVPSTLTVTNNLDSGQGSLRYEIAHASRNSTIVFAPSLDGQTITLTSGELDITTGLTIEGPGAGQLTISGDHNSRVFEVNARNPVVLSGLTISNGTALSNNVADPYWSEGGGILNLSTLTVSGCILSGNTVPSTTYGLLHANGGGIYNAGTLTVSNSTLSSNQADGSGGGIYNAGTATISGCTLSSPSGSLTNVQTRQSANDGAGIYNAGTLTVNSCIFSYNFASYFGGAIDNQGTLTVSNSVFSNNFAGSGRFAANIYGGGYTDGGGNTFA